MNTTILRFHRTIELLQGESKLTKNRICYFEEFDSLQMKGILYKVKQLKNNS